MSPCEGSRLRGGEEGSVSPWKQDATGWKGGRCAHVNPPCLPEPSLRLSPERRRPGTCCRRRSEASAGERCRKQSRVPLRMTVAAAAPPGSPQPHMAAAPGPARPLRRSRTRPPGAGEGGGAPCPPRPPRGSGTTHVRPMQARHFLAAPL